MRTTERLRKLKSWVYKELCEGREMKAPAPNMDIGVISRKEPQCYLAWAPARMNEMGQFLEDAESVIPGIIIMPNQAHSAYTEEKRFDRYNGVHRPEEMGDHLSVSLLFSVYEPGIRLPGFVESANEYGKGLDMSLIEEGTEQGLFTLLDWMDDFKDALLGAKIIPGTDLEVEEETVTYSLYMDQSYVVDRRPIYYGFVNASFAGAIDRKPNDEISKLL